LFLQPPLYILTGGTEAIAALVPTSIVSFGKQKSKDGANLFKDKDLSGVNRFAIRTGNNQHDLCLERKVILHCRATQVIRRKGTLPPRQSASAGT
jgi:hypothetical protein